MRSDGSALNVRRWLRSAGFAVQGIGHAYRTQANFRIEVWAAVLATGVATWLAVPLTPILLCCMLVLSLELVNTAIEAAIDLGSPGHHPLAKVAKDAAAAAVLIASFGALLVGLLLLLPPLWAKIVG